MKRKISKVKISGGTISAHGFEQQRGETLDAIDRRHKRRYGFAAYMIGSQANKPAAILDAACGAGYGSAILGDAFKEAAVHGFDCEPAALDIAARCYKRENVTHFAADLNEFQFFPFHYDAAVSIETIEHLENAVGFVRTVHTALREGGIFVASVPNQSVVRFNPQRHRYHKRHYTAEQLEGLLTSAGFEIVFRGSQDKPSMEIYANTRGFTLMFVARKP